MKKQKAKKYYSYGKRVMYSVIIFIIFMVLTLFFLIQSFNYKDTKVVRYVENSDLDYEVCLKENNFYEEKCLKKDMIYVASLIDNVKINFDYKFSIEKKIEATFNYKIIGKLVIQDETEKHNYYEKEYVLLNKKSVSMNDNFININETINIDYNKYNLIASSFENNYGLNSISKLIVYFNIEKNSDINKEKSTIMMINIPLSKRAININMDYKSFNKESVVVNKKQLSFSRIICFIFFIMCLPVTLVCGLKVVKYLEKVHTRKTKYDNYINKLLREYDRLIVETTTSPFLEERNIIKVKEFKELLDVRDNVKEPIMYYEVMKHQKSYFYIEHNNKIYLTQIKAIDIEERE